MPTECPECGAVYVAEYSPGAAELAGVIDSAEPVREKEAELAPGVSLVVRCCRSGHGWLHGHRVGGDGP